MRWLLLGVLVACGGRAGNPSNGPDGDRPATGRSWRDGVGVDGCALGAAVADCERALGASTRDGEYVTFGAAGVQVLLVGERVETVFVMYRSKDTSPFVGADPSGIGASSTPDDVERVYGTPSYVGDSEVSEYGEFPGAQDHSLLFGARGLAFTFYDGALAHVAIGRPEPTAPD